METEGVPTEASPCHAALDEKRDVYLIMIAVVFATLGSLFFLRSRVVDALFGRAFRKADANHDGAIDLAELHAAVLLLYVSVPVIKVQPPSRKAIEALAFEGNESKTLNQTQFRATMGMFLAQFIYRSIGMLILLPLSGFVGKMAVAPAIRTLYLFIDVPFINVEAMAGFLGPCEMAVIRSALPPLFRVYDSIMTNYADAIVPSVSVVVASLILIPFIYDYADTRAQMSRKKQHAG